MGDLWETSISSTRLLQSIIARIRRILTRSQNVGLVLPQVLRKQHLRLRVGRGAVGLDCACKDVTFDKIGQFYVIPMGSFALGAQSEL